MPFPMTHLYIAYNIIKSTPQISKPCDFMLGAIAPDSIHFREDYQSDMKKVSHLCVSEEKWGRVSNNQEWLDHVLAFLDKNKNLDHKDFIYGYCSHIIADIQNNIKIWMPFLKENSVDLDQGKGSVYHEESYEIDFVLYLSNPDQKVIWEMLEDATGYDIPKLVVNDEISRLKHNILYKQFLNREPMDVSQNKYVTIPCIQTFISEESQYIKKLLYANEEVFA